jgi:hypothetical protein
MTSRCNLHQISSSVVTYTQIVMIVAQLLPRTMLQHFRHLTQPPSHPTHLDSLSEASNEKYEEGE